MMSLDDSMSLNFFDFVFIDANHSYDHVRADIGAWRKKIKPTGFISGHDYNHPRFPGVKTAVKEAFGNVEIGVDHTWFHWMTPK